MKIIIGYILLFLILLSLFGLLIWSFVCAWQDGYWYVPIGLILLFALIGLIKYLLKDEK